jgi:hypothetical protein
MSSKDMTAAAEEEEEEKCDATLSDVFILNNNSCVPHGISSRSFVNQSNNIS